MIQQYNYPHGWAWHPYIFLSDIIPTILEVSQHATIPKTWLETREYCWFHRWGSWSSSRLVFQMWPHPYAPFLLQSNRFSVLKVSKIFFFSSSYLPWPKILMTWWSHTKLCEYSAFLIAFPYTNFKGDRQYIVMVALLMNLSQVWFRIFNMRPLLLLGSITWSWVLGCPIQYFQCGIPLR